MLNAEDFFETDVLVIGGGGAGARASIEANELNVLLANKGLFGKSGTTRVASGISVPIGSVDGDDNPKSYFEDIIAGELYVLTIIKQKRIGCEVVSNFGIKNRSTPISLA